MPDVKGDCNGNGRWQWPLMHFLPLLHLSDVYQHSNSLKVQVSQGLSPLPKHRAVGWMAADLSLPGEHEAVAPKRLPLPGGELAGIEAHSPQHPHSCRGGRQKVCHLLHRVVVQGLPRRALPQPCSASACRWQEVLTCSLSSLQPHVSQIHA